MSVLLIQLYFCNKGTGCVITSLSHDQLAIVTAGFTYGVWITVQIYRRLPVDRLCTRK